ncbi:MAG: hypothetical protein MZV70_75485 [Desulfobacterales bacterium]|nr:hypothetical protein [Desulfobacterales bacterium]
MRAKWSAERPAPGGLGGDAELQPRLRPLPGLGRPRPLRGGTRHADDACGCSTRSPPSASRSSSSRAASRCCARTSSRSPPTATGKGLRMVMATQRDAGRPTTIAQKTDPRCRHPAGEHQPRRRRTRHATTPSAGAGRLRRGAGGHRGA